MTSTALKDGRDIARSPIAKALQQHVHSIMSCEIVREPDVMLMLQGMVQVKQRWIRILDA